MQYNVIGQETQRQVSGGVNGSFAYDEMGRPVEAYDEEGNLVWERELDINGKVLAEGKDSYSS